MNIVHEHLFKHGHGGPGGLAAIRGGAFLLSLALTLGLASPASAETPPAGDRTLVLEGIEVEGNTRTDATVVLDRVNLRPGDPLEPAMLLDAVAGLRQAQLFSQVAVHTRPGSEPGRVVAVFQVQEQRPHLRLGAGYEDLSGWYLIPIQLNLDNVTGHGEALNVSSRLGYRVAGLVLSYRSSPVYLRRSYWGVRLRAEAQDRIYFQSDTELNHRVARGGVDLGFGGPLSHRLAVSATLSLETVEPDSHATVYQNREVLGRERGDDVAYDDLPPDIQGDLGRRTQARLALSLTGDGRRGSGLEMRGVRGQLRFEGVYSEESDFLSLIADGRGYAPLGRNVLFAGRVRAAFLTDEAPFYERFYLGGLYTVRGFPSQSLSPPGGDTRLVTASVEMRSSWVGPPRNPRVTGLLFLDAGWAGDTEGFDPDDIAVGVGYGWRVRVPWVQRIGLDIGVPLTTSVFDESFHVNLSLGWTY